LYGYNGVYLMFGKKFGKKKNQEIQSESTSRQKNDLFTLLEESPKNSGINIKTNVMLKQESTPKAEITPKADTTPKAEETPKTEATLKPVVTSKKDETPKKEATLKTDETLKPEKNSITLANPFTDKKFKPQSSIKGDKSQLLVLEVEKLDDKTIKPTVDFNESALFYPILSSVGESPDNISYLDELVTEGVFIKQVYEKLIICPIHPDTYSTSVRLYCPKCTSLNVDKLNLFEHKRCGFITENTAFDFSDPKNHICPSCNREIKDFKKEIRIPAAWHQCLDCEEKFDNAEIKLYCRKHEHDFDTNSGQFLTTYSYKLKDIDIQITSDDEKLHDDLAKLLKEYNFSTEFSSQIKGKSGNSHKIPIYAKNKSRNESIAIFISPKSEILTQTSVNTILISILDISPKKTLLLSTSKVDDDVKSMARQYGIQIISDSDFSKIIANVEEFVSKDYSKFGDT